MVIDDDCEHFDYTLPNNEISQVNEEKSARVAQIIGAYSTEM